MGPPWESGTTGRFLGIDVLADPAAVARTDAHIMQRYARFMQDGMPPPRVYLTRQVRRERAQHRVETGRMPVTS
jgi:hypothetical protein